MVSSAIHRQTVKAHKQLHRDVPSDGVGIVKRFGIPPGGQTRQRGRETTTLESFDEGHEGHEGLCVQPNDARRCAVRELTQTAC